MTWASVLVVLLICTLTAGPELLAAAVTPPPATPMTTAPTRARNNLRFMRATPFHEGVSAWRSEAGLLAYGPTNRAFPATSRHQWRFVRLASPITVAGPRRIRTGF